MIYHQSVIHGIVKLKNHNKRYVRLLTSYHVLQFITVFYAAANLGKTSVKFLPLCHCRGENVILICESAMAKPW